MTETINWNLSVRADDCSEVNECQTLNVEAYDKIQVVIARKEGNRRVYVQPAGKDEVRFVLIKSDQYGGKLTYRINSPYSREIQLDALHLFMGNGALELLQAPPNVLYFTNDLANNVTIQIIVGRNGRA